MKILMTGGAGFIASHIVDRYLQLGHEVAVLDDLSTGARENIAPNARFFECDIRDADGVAKAFREYSPHVVSHHAAHIDVTRAVADPVYDASVNINGALNVLLSAVENGAQRFVFASSGGAIYGQPQFLPVDETHPILPASPYGLTKFAFENYLRIWAELHGIVPVILRYANVYGPRQGATGEGGVVAVFSRALLNGKQCRIFGDGTMTRDYVFVGDIVEANVLALTRGDNAAVNIATQTEISTQQVFDAVRAACEVPNTQPHYEEERVGEVRKIYLDNAHAREVLGWKPQTSFRDGIEKTVAWQKTQMK
jgi:UDP-glucose 4-epimerase